MFNPYSFQGGTATLDPQAAGLNGQGRMPDYLNQSFATTPGQVNYGAMPVGTPAVYPAGFPTPNPYQTIPTAPFVPGYPFGFNPIAQPVVTPWGQVAQVPWGMQAFGGVPYGIPAQPFVGQNWINPFAVQQVNPFVQPQLNPFVQPQFNPFAGPQFNPFVTPQVNPFTSGFGTTPTPFPTTIPNVGIPSPVTPFPIPNPYGYNAPYGTIPNFAGYNGLIPSFANTTVCSPWGAAFSPFCFPGQSPFSGFNPYNAFGTTINPIQNPIGLASPLGTTNAGFGLNPFGLHHPFAHSPWSANTLNPLGHGNWLSHLFLQTNIARSILNPYSNWSSGFNHPYLAGGLFTPPIVAGQPGFGPVPGFSASCVGGTCSPGFLGAALYGGVAAPGCCI